MAERLFLGCDVGSRAVKLVLLDEEGRLVDFVYEPNTGIRDSLLAATRNEFESFQVHVRAGTAAVALTVEMGDLVDARSGVTIAAASGTVVWREAYLDLAHVSDLNGTAGVVPDPLVPAIDPVALTAAREALGERLHRRVHP